MTRSIIRPGAVAFRNRVWLADSDVTSAHRAPHEPPQPQGTDDADGDKMIATLRAAALQVGVAPDRAVEHFLGREEFDAAAALAGARCIQAGR